MDLKYEITRKNIKNIILKVNAKGQITVSAPFHVPAERIDSFVESKKDWIEKKIKDKDNENYFPILKKEYAHKDKVMFLGELKTIFIEKTDYNQVYLSSKYIYVFHNNLSEKKITKLIHDWLLEVSNNLLKKMTEKYSILTNHFPDRIVVKNLNYAWGVYHKRNNYISFNIKLMEKTEDLIEYVVLHEICHIKYQNHQKEFWDYVGKYMPDYKAKRKALKGG